MGLTLDKFLCKLQIDLQFARKRLATSLKLLVF